MKPYLDLTLRGKARRLRKLVDKALKHYALDVQGISLMTNDVNGIFRLDCANGQKWVMRVAIPDAGYDIDHYITEMTWLDMLSQHANLNAPVPLKTQSGDYVVTVADAGVPQPRHCCIFSWVNGVEIAERCSAETFELFGNLSASLHILGTQLILPNSHQLLQYNTPFPFKEPNVLFKDEHQQNFTDEHLQLIESALNKVQSELNTLYQDEAGLRVVHGDLHQWNVLINRKQVSPIDFEDMMQAYPIQDIGVTLYYNRSDDNYAELLAGFKRGYETIASFPETYTGQLETHILIRRLGLLNFVLSAEEIDIGEIPDMIPTTIQRIRHLQENIW